MYTLIVILALVLATSASAVDPECVEPKVADPAVRYNARDGIKLCAPSKDKFGNDLLPEEIDTCTVAISTSPTATIEAVLPAEPGQYLVYAMPAGIPKITHDFAYCTGPGGRGESTAVYETFNPKPPGQPWWYMLKP